MSRESYMLYKTELDLLATLPPRQAVAVLQALMEGEPPTGLSPTAQALYKHIDQHAATDRERYERKKSLSAERSRKYREKRLLQQPENKEVAEDASRSVTQRHAPSRPVTHNNNKKYNNKKCNNEYGEEETSSSSSGDARGDQAPTPSATASDDKKKKKIPIKQEQPELVQGLPSERNLRKAKISFGMDGDVFRFADHTHITREGFKEAWNRTMEDSRIPCIREMTEERWLLACSLMERFSLADIDHGLRRAKRSPKLNGSGGEGYVATFDWLLQPRNFLKCLEGNYG